MPSDPFDAMQQRSYFFDEGLRFECQQCGACCVGDPGTIFVSRAEAETIAAHLQMPAAAFTHTCLYPYKSAYSIKEDDTGRCLFFDGGCTIYAVRPGQCRTFPFWFSNLRSQSRWRWISRQCPGIGRGPLFSREQILSIVQSAMML